jgi:hypothetical protein
VSDVRCRACGAAVPAEAQWCSLCFADLREPTPVRERVSVPAASTAALAEASVAAPAPNGVRPDPDALLGLPKPAADSVTDDVAEAEEPAEEPEEAKWPCLTCGEQVPISLDACQSCGAGFLAGSSSQPSARLPVVGDLQRLSRNQRLAFGFGMCMVVMILLIVLATIGGHLL